jgi:molecular chaperone DnaK
MYAAAEADQAAAGGASEATGDADDDVVDAEIVDEDTDQAGDSTEGESK